MKKLFIHITLGLSLCGGLASAQDSTQASAGSGSLSFKSRRGHEVLPQAGDWALGISATAPLNYFGNLVNGTDGNFVGGAFSYVNRPFILSESTTLFGKKFIDSKTAYRVRLNVIATSNRQTFDVLKDEAAPDVNYPSYVEDIATTSRAGFTLGLGKEMRRGSSRVQGVYGAEALLGVYSSSVKHDFGNELSLDFPQATTVLSGYSNGERLKEVKGGTSFFIGVRPFIGVEYFFAPKMSIGGEFGYVVGYSNGAKSTNIFERYDAASNSVVEVTRKNNFGTNRFLGISPENFNAALNLLLYF